MDMSNYSVEYTTLYRRARFEVCADCRAVTVTMALGRYGTASAKFRLNCTHSYYLGAVSYVTRRDGLRELKCILAEKYKNKKENRNGAR